MADIFIAGIPSQVNEYRVRKQLEPYCRSVGIHSFNVHLIRGRSSPCAILTLPTTELATLFISCYGRLSQLGKPRMNICINGQPIMCSHSRQAPRDIFVVKSLVESQNRAKKEERSAQPAHLPSAAASTASAPRDKDPRKFDILGFECGAWATETVAGYSITFNPRYMLARPGTLSFRPQSVLIDINLAPPSSPDPALAHDLARDLARCLAGLGLPPAAPPAAERCTMVIHYTKMIDICTDSRTHVFFALDSAPRIYFNRKTMTPLQGERLSRERIAGVELEHEAYAGFSLVYKFSLLNPADHAQVIRLSKTAGIPPINPKSVVSVPASPSFLDAFTGLVALLQDRRLFSYRPAFQLNALVSNGIVPPETVQGLLPRVRRLILDVGDDVAAEILKRLVIDDLGRVGSSTSDALQALEQRIHRMRHSFTREHFAKEKERYSDMAYVHRIMITPTGVFSYGPRWEASNRVLRQYKDYNDYFLRVQFCEEDGDQFRHEPRVSVDRILREQFLKPLDAAAGGALVIAGRHFEFLGFSSSSLKSQSCWFMAPFAVAGGEVMTAEKVITSLGDFSHIRAPGRYAARVGQAFSDTIGSALVEADHEVRIDDIERRDSSGTVRNFSDGIGKISRKMVERIWKTSDKIGAARPTVFQIRYAGAKGVIALDPTLKGDKLCLRKSMVKFEGSTASNIELCSWASRLPMFLNRPLIKVLEDLGIEDRTFLRLQKRAVDRLRDSSKTAALAANFLKRRGVSSPCLRLPWLFEGLKNIGMDFWDDSFLARALELSLLTDLRDIKYRGRIPVSMGVTLLGVLDETKLLEEGEVFVNTDDDDGNPEPIEGLVLITRSPVHHPGDVQMVNAVRVPATSPLRQLRNVVVFSQNGDRPLPSMLAGGDLDGDLYNVIYDPSFNLKQTFAAAEYPSAPPVELDRAVVASDVAKFFVDFIENNLLGMISIRHLTIADQQKEGVFHPDCLILAQLASVAVDFPKTGHKVDRRQLPRGSAAKPDFLAPGPRVLISKDRVVHDVAREDDDDENNHVQTWYASEKILGKLYREIDEEAFLQGIRREIQLEGRSRPASLLGRLFTYFRRQMVLDNYELDLARWLEFARDSRTRYEETLRYHMVSYSETPWKSTLSEVEVFVGAIIGGRDKQGRRQRETASAMKEEFCLLAEFTVDELKDGSRSDILDKCMACLHICLPDGTRHAQSDLRSFAWLAASVMMSEMDAIQKERRRREAAQRGR